MAVISTQEARNMLTKKLVAKYVERPKVFSFLRSFFPSDEAGTRLISIEVSRGTEKVAVDVLRGTEGNRNTFSRSTEKVMEPPYYKEFFDATQLDLYDRLFASEVIDASAFAGFVDSVDEKLMLLVDKIERRYELQCAQVFDTGIVTVANGDNIDFKRKATSLVNNSSNTWATDSNNPFSHLEAGANFLRQVGKVQGGSVNVIMGSSALNAFLQNANVKVRADIRNFSLDAIRAPQRDSVGATLHGTVSAGAYNFVIWSYPEFYDDASGVSTPYINPKKVILLPEQTKFKMGFGAVPQVYKGQATIQKGAFVFGDYLSEREDAHIFDVKSAGIAIPVAVDQIYTTQVLV